MHIFVIFNCYIQAALIKSILKTMILKNSSINESTCDFASVPMVKP